MYVVGLCVLISAVEQNSKKISEINNLKKLCLLTLSTVKCYFTCSKLHSLPEDIPLNDLYSLL